MAKTHLDATRHEGLPTGLCGWPSPKVTDDPERVTCAICKRRMAEEKVAELEQARAETFPVGDRSFSDATVAPLPMGELTRAQARLWRHLYEELAEVIQHGAQRPRSRLPRETRWASLGHAMAEMVQVRLDGYPMTSTNDPDRLQAMGGLLGRSYSPPGPDHRSRLAEDVAEAWKAFQAAFEGAWDGGRFSRFECEVMFLGRYVGRAKVRDIAAWLNEQRCDRVPPSTVSRITRFGEGRVYEYLRTRGLIPRQEDRREKGSEGEMASKASDCDLFGWKEIADFVGVHVDTAKKYERDEGMPIYRFRREVRAKKAELRTWTERLEREQGAA